jgi:uncharacterized membrane protein
MERINRIVDFFYHKTILPSALTVVVIYAAFVKANWAPYVLSPAVIMFTATLISKLFITLYDYGVLRFTWNVFKYCCKWMFGYFRSFTANKIVLFLIFLGIINLVGFTAFWVGYNIDITQIVAALYGLVVKSVMFITDPKEIMTSVVNLLDKFHVRVTLDVIHTNYVIPAVNETMEGKTTVLYGVSFISLGLIIAAFMLKWMFRIIFDCCRSRIGNGSQKEVNDYLNYLSQCMENPIDAHIVDDKIVSIPQPILDDVKDVIGPDNVIGSQSCKRVTPPSPFDILKKKYQCEQRKQREAEMMVQSLNEYLDSTTASSSKQHDE